MQELRQSLGDRIYRLEEIIADGCLVMDLYDWQSSLLKFAIYVVDTEQSKRLAYLEQSNSGHDPVDRRESGDRFLPIQRDASIASSHSILRSAATP